MTADARTPVHGEARAGRGGAIVRRRVYDPPRVLPRDPHIVGEFRRTLLRLGAVLLAGYVAVGAVLLVAGLAITETELAAPLRRGDAELMEFIVDNRVAVLDGVTATMSQWAATWTIVVGACAAALVLLLLRLWRPVAVLAVGLLMEITVFLSVNAIVGRPRPDGPMDETPATASFPSGHAAAAVVLYGSLAIVVAALTGSKRGHRAAVWVAGLVAVAVADSRVYRGLHFPSDVVAGALLGALCLVVGLIAAQHLPQADGYRARSSPPT